MKRTRPLRPILAVKNLRIERSGTVILDAVNWRVAPGEHWAVLGANGSGKTSLLSALTGYFMPTAGELELLGQRYGHADWRELRCRVGIVSSAIRQMMADAEPALATVISGKRAMIELWGEVSAAEARGARQILAQVECTHLAARPWGVLSQGERQRVLIGRALMARPKLLILDEPCTGLDPAAREHFLQFLQRLCRRRQAPAIVLVTHHVEEIMPAFTHALLLRQGQVLAAGPKAAVLTSPHLSRAFAAAIRLTRKHDRYALRVLDRRRVVV
jgi:iron complex transport system ATP-binding protein